MDVRRTYGGEGRYSGGREGEGEYSGGHGVDVRWTWGGGAIFRWTWGGCEVDGGGGAIYLYY